MPYTFGAATTDDVQIPIVPAVTGPSVSGFLLIWALPTTLTAGRCIAGFGNNLGRIAIHSTTSEISITLGCGTTDGVWASSGLGLTVDNWAFLAIAWTAIAGPTMDVKLWKGDAITPPVAVSISQATAPVGTFSSQTTLTIGNGSAAVGVAWQGDLAQLDVLSTNIAGGAGHPFGQSAYGAFSAESVDVMFSRIVLPIWRNEKPMLSLGKVINNTTNLQHVSCDLTLQAAAMRHIQTSSANESIAAPTYSGVTPSQRGCPRPRFGHSVAGVPGRIRVRR